MILVYVLQLEVRNVGCNECGYHEHADIGAAKTIRDRGLEIVRGDSAKLAV